MSRASSDHYSSTIIVSPLAPRPTKFIIREERVITGNPFEKDYKPDVVVEHDFPGFGLYWEADAVARSLRGEWVRPLFQDCSTRTNEILSDGELENPRMPHAETKMTMEVGVHRFTAPQSFAHVRCCV